MYIYVHDIDILIHMLYQLNLPQRVQLQRSPCTNFAPAPPERVA